MNKPYKLEDERVYLISPIFLARIIVCAGILHLMFIFIDSLRGYTSLSLTYYLGLAFWLFIGYNALMYVKAIMLVLMFPSYILQHDAALQARYKYTFWVYGFKKLT